MAEPRKTLYLCGGLQSSGTTLVSWCFLQRADMNGALDADNDPRAQESAHAKRQRSRVIAASWDVVS